MVKERTLKECHAIIRVLAPIPDIIWKKRRHYAPRILIILIPIPGMALPFLLELKKDLEKKKVSGP